MDIADVQSMAALFDEYMFDYVVNLAAQAGVLYSRENPQSYIQSNLVGFANILEGCRQHKVRHLVYASSSSVYGANRDMPFSESNSTNHPISLYAATKKSNEMMAHSYAHMFGLPSTGLRFFTVYGPWGRPDMAMFKFIKAILNDERIDVYNHGKSQRDFTYIDDIVEGVYRCIFKTAKSNPNWDGFKPTIESSEAPYQIFNIGNNEPCELMYLIEVIEKALGKKAKKNFLDLPAGDVPATYANVDKLNQHVGFHPGTPIEKGVQNLIHWYRDYYKV